MKRIVLVALSVVSFCSVSFSEFSRISVRLQGINPDLAGIVSDEYSNVFSVNRANILDIKGYRAYTNFSNLYDGNIGNDRAFGGITTGGTGANSFLLGGFGSPFEKNMPVGFFYNAVSAITPQANNLTGTGGEATSNATLQTDSNGDGNFSSTGDSTRITNQNANRNIDSGMSSYEALFGYGVAKDVKFGLGLSYSNADLSGNASSVEKITASDYRQNTVLGTPNIVTTQNNSLSAEDTNENSTISIFAAGKLNLLKNFNLGIQAGIMPYSQERTRTSRASFNIDLSQQNANTAAALLTGTASATDGSNNTLPGGFGIIAGNVTDNLVFTNPATWDGINLSSIISGDEVGSFKSSGTGIKAGVDTEYRLMKILKFYGQITLNMIPVNITANLSQPYSEVYTSSSTAASGLNRRTKDNNTSYVLSGNGNNTTIGVTAGGSAELANNVLLGFGLLFTNSTMDRDTSYTMSRRDVSTTDSNNDGNVTSDGTDNTVIITDSDSGKIFSETKTTGIRIPVGLEMKPWKKFAVRMGVSHRISSSKTTSTNKILNNGLRKTDTTQNNTTASVYEGTPKTTASENTTVSESLTRSTQYYYGMGYEWSENLVFDILGFSGAWGIGGGFNLLDLSTWRISATLKF